MLSDLIAKRKISVYQVAKGSGLPYTTVNELVLGKKDPGACNLRTIAALAEFFQMPLDAFIRLLTEEKSDFVCETREETKKKKYRFPVIVPTEAFEISRIHPLKQKEILAIQRAIKEDPRIEAVTVFGSSTGILCHRKSDVDICVCLRPEFINYETKNEVSEAIQEACDYDADILWADRIQSGTMIDRNIHRGVQIL